jgi:glyoxylase-like metal-dependent hydrolase (beta-lactamase superfamily II)
MLEKGTSALESARRQNAAFKQVKIIPPHLTFDQGTLSLKVGKKSLVLNPLLGHSEDGIGVLVEEDRVFFAGDSFLPLPFIVDGDLEESVNTIRAIGKMGLENIIQGHGDVILRGEIDGAVRENLAYLAAVKKGVKAAQKKRDPLEYLEEIDIESCGKSRVHLGGLAGQLHKRNLRALLDQFSNGRSSSQSDADVI